ncbi:MAG TPA: hypothetical protein VFS00_11425, partial [Polyangiaceae bacterium]|nr:hypothetical protein [Polyangiaceae bacterium]
GGAGGSGGTGGVGGQPPVGDFQIALVSSLVRVPYGGKALVGVELTRTGGFAGPVEVRAEGAPAGFASAPLAIAEGAKAGELEVGATGGLALGTEFELRVTASAGPLSHEASAPAIVTGKPGSPDLAFGVEGVLSWVFREDGGNFYDLKESAQGKILLGGESFSGLGASRPEGFRITPAGALDPAFNAGGSVNGIFCGCTKPAYARGIFRLFNGNVVLLGTGAASGDATFDVGVLNFDDAGAAANFAGDDNAALVDLGGEDEAFGVAQVDEERFAVVGTRGGQLFASRLIVTSESARVDSIFGELTGTTLPLPPGAPSAGRAVAVDPADNLVVAGTVLVGPMPDSAVVVPVVLRLRPDGKLDPDFGEAGVATFDTYSETGGVKLHAPVAV